LPDLGILFGSAPLLKAAVLRDGGDHIICCLGAEYKYIAKSTSDAPNRNYRELGSFVGDDHMHGNDEIEEVN